MAMIHLKNIRKTYYGKDVETKVLKGIDLEIEKGEFVCIFGTSGCGKSTLLNILGLLDQATEGVYELEGTDVMKLGKNEGAAIRNQKIGFVFQAYHLIPEINVLENIVVPLGYAGVPKKEREQAARKLLNEFGMDHLEKKYISQMSGGEQQRVSIMRAIVNNPSLLLADEPTGNLDKENTRKIMEILRKLSQEGMTIVMVTHDTELSQYATRGYRLKKEESNVLCITFDCMLK